MSSHGREPASTKVKEVLASGEGRFDLTRPPSREEAGMPVGWDEVSYENADTAPFRAHVTLPGGQELDVTARLLTFGCAGAADPDSAPPTTLDIHHYPADLEVGRDHMLDLARRFGLDAEYVRQWYEEARGERPIAAAPRVTTPWSRVRIGYLDLSVQAVYLPPVDTPRSALTTVHYLLTWGAGVSPTPS